MNEPVKFPVFVVMRNDHIMPTGIYTHRANAEAAAVREEGEVVPLSADEQRGIKRTLQRRLADVVRGITHTSFGPENTKVG